MIACDGAGSAPSSIGCTRNAIPGSLRGTVGPERLFRRANKSSPKDSIVPPEPPPVGVTATERLP